MKKNILILLSIMMASATTAWGQSVRAFNPQYTNYSPVGKASFVYDGQEKTGVLLGAYNCYGATITGDKATNAGIYQAEIRPECQGHLVPTPDVAEGYFMYYDAGTTTVDWQILPRDLRDGVEITVKDQQWTGRNILANKVYTLKYKDNDLRENVDFNVLITKMETPTTILDEGRYTIVFTGRGNFTGQIVRTFDVKKDISQGEDITGVHFDIPEQIIVAGTSFDFQCEVSDKISHAKLYENEDYTVAFYDDAAATNDDEIEETAVNLGNGEKAKKYWVVFTGVAPKYDPETSIKKAFYIVSEYQESAPSPATLDPNVRGNLNGLAKVNIRITKPGYPVALDSPNGVVELGEAKVAPTTDGAPAIDIESTRCMILDTIKVAVAVDDETTEYVNHNIVGIENNAFAGCKTLRWINSLIPGTYVPTSLDRTVIDTPFYGIPRQTLVYLYGYNITGENYIYKITENDFRSALFHIYEDVKGDQTKYSDQK
jgi:hypothetical protein